MTYDDLLARCRRTLDLHPETDVQLRDVSKLMARGYTNAHTKAAIYACLWENVVDYLDQLPNSTLRDGPFAASNEEPK